MIILATLTILLFPILTPKLTKFKIRTTRSFLCASRELLLTWCVGGTTAPFDGDNVSASLEREHS